MIVMFLKIYEAVSTLWCVPCEMESACNIFWGQLKPSGDTVDSFKAPLKDALSKA
jgi:hypothetical protein